MYFYARLVPGEKTQLYLPAKIYVRSDYQIIILGATRSNGDYRFTGISACA